MKYITKLGFNLAIIGAEIMIVVSLLAVFLHWWSPAFSVFSVILFAISTYTLIHISRRFAERNRPSLTATTWVVIGVLILSTFAGIQPMSSVKDKAFNAIKSQTQSIALAPVERTLVGKWQEVVDNKVSIMSPTIQFLGNGTVILDDGRQVVTGTYTRLTDEYVKISVETSFFGMPITSMDTLKYKIQGDKLTIRVGSSISTYKWIE